ncbi:MAG: cupin domain-containing protein [Ruegeria sp.]
MFRPHSSKKGTYEFTVDDRTLKLGPGDSVIIPSNEDHSCVCLQAGELGRLLRTTTRGLSVTSRE